MKPARLDLQAFGAYGKRLQLDFGVLPEDALFLIHGPTGGGKTTILDAICYALFGETSARGEREPRQLRSDHAALDAETYVTLDFYVRGILYRVRRSPDYERPAKRGGGTTRQQATAQLVLLDEKGREGEPLAQRVRQVDDEIVALLGIDVKQFRQTALLPQGQFRDLLSAGSKEREAIMAALFDTGILGDLQRYLLERVQQLRRESEQLEMSRKQRLEQCDCEDEAQLQRSVKALEKAMKERIPAITASGKALDRATKKLNLAAETNAKIATFEKAKASLVKLEGRLKDAKKLKKALKTAKKAQKLDPLLGLFDDHTKVQKRAEQAHAKIEQKLKAARFDLEKKSAGRADLIVTAGELLFDLEVRRDAAEKNVAAQQAGIRELETAWRAGRAAQLAKSLIDGKPCPVCGADHHPDPASSEDTIPDDDEIDQAREALAELQEAADLGKRAITNFKTYLRSLELKIEPEQHGGSTGISQTKWERLWQTHVTALGAAAELVSRLEVELKAADGSMKEARRAQKKSSSNLMAGLEKAGFDDLDAFQTARHDDPWIEANEARIKAFDADYTKAVTALEIAKEAAPDPDAETDIAPLKENCALAKKKHEAGLAAQAGDEERKKQWVLAKASLDKMVAQLAELRNREKNEGYIADLANGRGGAGKITFQRFVLASLLDEALDAASQRLRAMSRGRYDLRRVTSAGDRRRSDGLELEIDDAHTGRSRPVQTLSGGESFQAALALALGLVDVVQRHEGGTRLELMFIDEGFGSLDPEALDLAMETLLELRSQGRMIGIISHVPELRERIDLRLEVEASREGSSARFVLP